MARSHSRIRISHVVGIDDAPCDPRHRADVLIAGAVYSGPTLEGVLSGHVRRDGANSTRVLADMVGGSRFRPHLQLIMLQGIALAGFNVVDLDSLAATLRMPILVVCRRQPNLAAIRRALLTRVPGGTRKWRLITQAGPMEPAAGVFVQRRGISLTSAIAVLERFSGAGNVPVPLRSAHLIASGIVLGESRHRA